MKVVKWKSHYAHESNIVGQNWPLTLVLHTPLTSSIPPTLLLWVLTLGIDIGDGPLTFISMLKTCGVGGGCTCDYNISSGCFWGFEIEIGDEPQPEPNILWAMLQWLACTSLP